MCIKFTIFIYFYRFFLLVRDGYLGHYHYGFGWRWTTLGFPSEIDGGYETADPIVIGKLDEKVVQGFQQEGIEMLTRMTEEASRNF